MKNHRTRITVLLVLAIGLPPAYAAAAHGADSPNTATAADRAITHAERRLATVKDDPTAKKSLAAAFLQKVRESADPTYYAKVDAILTTLGGPTSKDPEVLLLEGTLLLARHDFAKALVVGERVVKALPASASAQGIVVDASNELGRYDEALKATQRMLNERPGLASLSRASYARELRGDQSGAILAMQQAVTAGPGSGENRAYVTTLLGNLLLSTGDVTGASSTYGNALAAFPGFAAALAGQAAVLAARGRPAEAASTMVRVVETQPLMQYAIAEGEYFRAAGNQPEADAAFQLVDAIMALYKANGVDIDLEVAVFKADRKPAAGLGDATRRAVQARPSVTGHDAYAWVLHRLGRHREAAAEIAKVVAVGDRDPVFRYHAAAIAAAVGNRAQAIEQFNIVVGSNPRAVGIDGGELQKLATSLGLTVPPPKP